MFNILLHYRNTPHSLTKLSPAVSLNGRNYITIREKVNPCYNSVNEPIIKVIPSFYVGDSVLALNLRSGPKWLQSTIVSKLGQNIYEVHVHELDVVWRRHKHQLLKSTNHSLVYENINFPRDEFPLAPPTSQTNLNVPQVLPVNVNLPSPSNNNAANDSNSPNVLIPVAPPTTPANINVPLTVLPNVSNDFNTSPELVNENVEINDKSNNLPRRSTRVRQPPDRLTYSK